MRIHVLLTFKKKTIPELEVYCNDVVIKMDGVERYANEQEQVTVVKEALEDYRMAIAAASDGGKSLNETKNKIKKELLLEMQDLALLVQINAKDDENYALDAGFEVRKKAVRTNRPLPQPEWNWLRRGVLTGTVEGEVKKFPTGVTEIGVEYSYDGWATSRNGTYSSGKKFTLKGLEIEKRVEVKVTFHGTYQRKSNESVSMPVFVL